MDAILTLNAGSSTVKVAVFDLTPTNKTARKRWVKTIPADTFSLPLLLKELQETFPNLTLKAIGHRMVHGGDQYTAPTLMTDDVLADLTKLIPLAPLHMPGAISLIKEATEQFATVPQVACFDTAFHATMPAMATQFALPQKYADMGIRRYGFHGLSYQYIAENLPKDAGERVIIAHLGSGASACALLNGKSVATSMGFSALDGMVMATRCGSIDAGVMLYLLEEHSMSVSALTELLYKQSGLYGVSGLSGDMQVLENLAHDGNPQAKQGAKQAIELFCYRAAQEMTALLPALKGVDTIIFTGGIGENSETVREGIMQHLHWLEAKTYVMNTDEESVMADGVIAAMAV